MTLESPTLAHPVLIPAFCSRRRWEFQMLDVGWERFPRNLELWNGKAFSGVFATSGSDTEGPADIK